MTPDTLRGILSHYIEDEHVVDDAVGEVLAASGDAPRDGRPRCPVHTFIALDDCETHGPGRVAALAASGDAPGLRDAAEWWAERDFSMAAAGNAARMFRAALAASGDTTKNVERLARALVKVFGPANGAYGGIQPERDAAAILAALASESPEEPTAQDVDKQRRVERQAHLAYLYLNIVTCPRCHLPAAAGYICPCGYDGAD